MFIRDMERIVRTLIKQRCELEYIKHYIVETYQVLPSDVLECVIKLARENPGTIGRQIGSQLPPGALGGKGHGAKAGGGDDGKIKKAGFFPGGGH